MMLVQKFWCKITHGHLSQGGQNDILGGQFVLVQIFSVCTRVCAVHLCKTTGKILRVVETYLIGNLGDVTITVTSEEEIFCNVQSVASDKLACTQTCFCIKTPANQTAAHTYGLAKLRNAEFAVRIVLFHDFRSQFHEGSVAPHLFLLVGF